MNPKLAIILIAAALLASGCISAYGDKVDKQVKQQECQVGKGTCESMCGQQPESEQTGCNAKCESDFYSCESG
ncbi:MAG TPA: hypothetical protein VLD37_03000 [Candidatus Bilamarchaeum sp.]|nr:hypothetical protein [Candidatus Bilamarchaeum sp.]